MSDFLAGFILLKNEIIRDLFQAMHVFTFCPAHALACDHSLIISRDNNTDIRLSQGDVSTSIPLYGQCPCKCICKATMGSTTVLVWRQ